MESKGLKVALTVSVIACVSLGSAFIYVLATRNSGNDDNKHLKDLKDLKDSKDSTASQDTNRPPLNDISDQVPPATSESPEEKCWNMAKDYSSKHKGSHSQLGSLYREGRVLCPDNFWDLPKPPGFDESEVLIVRPLIQRKRDAKLDKLLKDLEDSRPRQSVEDLNSKATVCIKRGMWIYGLVAVFETLKKMCEAENTSQIYCAALEFWKVTVNCIMHHGQALTKHQVKDMSWGEMSRDIHSVNPLEVRSLEDVLCSCYPLNFIFMKVLNASLACLKLVATTEEAKRKLRFAESYTEICKAVKSIIEIKALLRKPPREHKNLYTCVEPKVIHQLLENAPDLDKVMEQEVRDLINS